MQILAGFEQVDQSAPSRRTYVGRCVAKLARSTSLAGGCTAAREPGWRDAAS